ncbi:MAG: ABC transporter ATP-binding protein, partial [Bacilli bacterium]
SIKSFEKYNNMLYDSGWKSQFISTSMHPLINFVGNISYVLISIYGGLLTIKNKIEVGSILSFTQYIRNLNQGVGNLSQILAMLQPTVAAAERVFEFLEEKEETRETKDPVKTADLKGNIEFKNVHFGYNEDKIIINDFSIKIKDGQKIAIVGPTGAGKTTMVKLLMRFYDVTSGSILVDGHDIRDFKRSDLRRMFGMVLQDTWLYNGTITDNIKYGKLDASIEEVKDASRAASVHHFIKTLPDDYDFILNEESDNISQGQKQLLTIARVILANPKILILDEATSSVDTRTEILIQEAMDKLMEGRTSFVIAHRLSTIKNADLILVMKDGDIVETGTHNELLKQGGFYESLYNSQFEEEV